MQIPHKIKQTIKKNAKIVIEMAKYPKRTKEYAFF